ncbi:MAG: hypothetical protein AB7P04_09905 [Bacteriovoracia bacterium]
MATSPITIEYEDFSASMRSWRVSSVDQTGGADHIVQLHAMPVTGMNPQVELDGETVAVKWEPVQGVPVEKVECARLEVDGQAIYCYACTALSGYLIFGTRHYHLSTEAGKSDWKVREDPGHVWAYRRLLNFVAVVVAATGLLNFLPHRSTAVVTPSTKDQVMLGALTLGALALLYHHYKQWREAQREGIGWKRWLARRAAARK